MSDSAERRIEALEARVAALEGTLRQLAEPPPPPPPPPPPAPAAGVTAPQGPVEWEPAPPPEPREQPWADLEIESALKWGGVGLVVLAVGFAVSTAISRGWIGPELQLAGAVTFSLGLIAVGIRLRPTRMPWTHALCSGGVAALFTTFASNLFLDQINTDVAYTATLVVGLGAVALAALLPSEWVAVTSLVGGIVGFLVIGDGEPPFGAALACLVLAVAVAIAVSLAQRWFGLRLLGHLVGIAGLVGMAVAADTGSQELAVLAAAGALAISLLWVPSVGDLESVWQQLEVQLCAVLAPWAVLVIGAVYELDGRNAVGATALATAGAAGVAALALRPSVKAAHFVSLVLGASVSLSIGVATLLSTEAAFLAIAVQGAGLVVLSRTLGGNVRVAINAGVLLFAAGWFATIDGVAAWADNTSPGADIARLAIIATLAVGFWQAHHRPTLRHQSGIVLTLVLVWLGSVLVHLPEGQAAVSVSWAVVGTALLVAGAIRKIPDLGNAGFAVLALTVGKLLLVDMNEVDTLWRAGLFFVVGLALLRLGFLLPRLTGAADER